MSLHNNRNTYNAKLNAIAFSISNLNIFQLESWDEQININEPDYFFTARTKDNTPILDTFLDLAKEKLLEDGLIENENYKIVLTEDNSKVQFELIQ
jgi:hypothetical protein